ncbi:hypothetical protein [Qipengyuania flava]|uniref:hypothetical protein n=1 Tax=Qipengyuania flava TaxID=192812 RepID=UPI001CD68C83|nr:hypothetical protein [Qipengyuania flava]MCA0889198.1 hypothetical protein [Qipengyuania flava]|tara:strand:+ start:230 stop:511 length:282 start_codon:yes stop_codon:yes gene_type:complete
MGEYAPDDQRDVRSSETAEWRETEQQQQQQRQPQDGDTPANMGYGNAHDAAGVSEQEKAQAEGSAGEATTDRADDARPDIRARADAARPLGSD